MYAYSHSNLIYFVFKDVLEKEKTKDVFRFLSKNETMATYKETDDELLILQLLSLQDAVEQDEQEGTEGEENCAFNKCIDEIVAESKKHHRAYHIWHSSHIVKYLLNLLNLGEHFTKSKVMQTAWLKAMSDSHGGVSAHAHIYSSI